jgi:hypothetical protein
MGLDGLGSAGHQQIEFAASIRGNRGRALSAEDSRELSLNAVPF